MTTALTFIAALTLSPFAHDAMVSWNTGGLTPIAGLAQQLRTPAVTIARRTPSPTPMGSSLMWSEEDAAEIAALYEPLLDCPDDAPCPVPPITSFFASDWTSVKAIYVGLNFEGLNQYIIDDPLDPLCHVKATMQTVRSVFLRDFGALIRVQHVHFEDAFTANGIWINDHARVDRLWDEQIRPFLTHEIHGVMRLVPYPGGHAWPTTCMVDNFYPNTNSIANYWFNADPRTQVTVDITQNGKDRTAMLSTVMHEMGHQFLHLPHFFCTGPSWSGQPYVESCGGGPAPRCFEGSSLYPDLGFHSILGCRGHYSPYAPAPRTRPWPIQRFGLPFSEQIAYGREQLLRLPCLETVGTLPLIEMQLMIDKDGDGVPDPIDVCPNTPDREQIDTDGDGIGDACEGGCAIVPGNHHSAWWLCIPAILLCGRRKVRETLMALFR